MLRRPQAAIGMLDRVLCSNMTSGCGRVVRRKPAQTTRRGSPWPYPAATGTVVAVALACLAVSGTGVMETVAAAATSAQAGASTAVQDVNVPAADLESVGIPGGVEAPVLLPRQPVLAVGGKVEVAYVGGGWCPYCALGNWPLQVALSQFGTFTRSALLRRRPRPMFTLASRPGASRGPTT